MAVDEVKVLAVPTKSRISATGMRRLHEHGVVLVHCDEPERVRLLRPALDVDVLPANEFMWAAVDALAQEQNFNDSDKMRRLFLSNMSGRMKAKLPVIPKEAQQK